jgi:hypothetical protein
VPSSIQLPLSSIDYNDWSFGITGLNNLAWPSDWIIPVSKENNDEEDDNSDPYYAADI